jgi:VanZ family protein
MIKRYKFSLLLSIMIFYLSLKNAAELNKVQFLNIPHFDKIAHFFMYFALMLAIIFETRNSAIKTGSLLQLSVIPFLYGIFLEILQSTITTTRNGNTYDVIFNSLGIIVSILFWLMIRSVYKKKFR